ncbi:MAG: hypothetical protein BWY79_02121 [Actinobacteria bacterium ADurb.Bin444]|nr:MAG: hypothetical protein BWY79_02121 [Actinobacteria bacterium ADurb.Bin444]
MVVGIMGQECTGGEAWCVLSVAYDPYTKHLFECQEVFSGLTEIG